MKCKNNNKVTENKFEVQINSSEDKPQINKTQITEKSLQNKQNESQINERNLKKPPSTNLNK